MLKEKYIIFALSLLIGISLTSTDKGCGCGSKPAVTAPKPSVPNVPVAKPVVPRPPAKKNIDHVNFENSSVIVLKNATQFSDLVLKEDSGNVLVKFGASWCPPCKALQ